MLNSIFALLQTAQVAPEESGQSGDLLSPNGGLMFWTFVTFVILLVILGKLVFPKITAAVEAREKALEEAIEGAKRDREAAAQALAEQQRQIETARNEAQRIIAESRQVGEKVRAQMIDETHQQQQQMLERARRVYPTARDVTLVEHRVGVRPMPSDRHTIAGRIPGFENAWMIATHSGVTLGPLLGRLLADEIVRGAPSATLAPFRPDRFAR